MARVNGFAVLRGPTSSLIAKKGIGRVERFGSVALLEIDGGSVIAYALGGDEPELPIVHGLSTGPFVGGEPQRGEFAFVAGEAGTLMVGRDALGTRPLYTNEDGSVVASDHRFFSGNDPRRLGRGATIRLPSMEVTQPRSIAALPHGNLQESVTTLSGLLEAAVERRVRGHRKVAVAFSGGLDSSLTAMLAARHSQVILCSAHAKASRDEREPVRAAEALDLEIRSTTLDAPTIAADLARLDLPFDPGPMDRALWCLYSATARLAAAEGAEVMLLGQLADELFGGYMKYAITARQDERRAAEAMAADVEASAERAFIRDEEACARFVEPRFPFADEEVAGFALGLPVSYKISGGQRKLILRLAALSLGLPEQLAQAPKKAAQYSSGIGKLVP